MNPASHGPASLIEKRVPGIDLLRGLCILAVVLHHINLRIRFNHSTLGQLLGPAANRVLFWSGYYGVRVFFVISGFLIAGWSLKRWGRLPDISRKQFYLMRFARIMPCLIALLLILAVLDRAGTPQFVINPQRTSLPRALSAALTFHINWLEAKTGYLPAAWDVLWSLSVEEVFYVLFPLLCTWVRRTVPLTGILLTLVFIGPFARVLAHDQLWGDYGYLACMDGIAVGCLAAIFAANVTLSCRANRIFHFAGSALCLLIVVFRGAAARIGFYKTGLDVTVLGIGTALLIIALQQRFNGATALGKAPGLSSKRMLHATVLLRWFGRNSYEVYLTHMLVVWPMVMLFLHFHQSIKTAPLWFLVITALSGAAGDLVARFYSEPLNRTLRQKLLPVRRLAAAQMTAD